MTPPNRKPPQLPPVFNIDEERLLKETESLIGSTIQLEDEIALEVSPQSACFANVVLPLAHNANKCKSKYLFIDLLRSNSPIPSVRDVCDKAISSLDLAHTASASREDLFALVDAVGQKDEELDPESKRLLVKYRRQFIQNGVGLPHGPGRDRFNEINKRLSENRSAFGRSISGDTTNILLYLDELKGVPDNVLERLPRDPVSGELRLSFKKPDLMAVLNHCQVESTRQKMYVKHQNICAPNVAIFQETVLLRDEMARLLGYDSFAAMMLETQMTKSPDIVNQFLDDLAIRLKPQAQLELERLIEMKKKDLISPSPSELQRFGFYLWDFQYYHQRLLEKEYRINHEKISEYFPANIAIRGMLDIFEHLFGLDISLLSEKEKGALSRTGQSADCVWHEDVEMFAVWNDESQGGDFVGYLYTDIYPRDGKYNTAANFSITPGFIDETGTRQYVATALICNLSAPTQSKPSLLKHHEIITLFHELGHGMHDLLSRTRYAAFHGYECAADFIEAPSQFLENWCWLPERLKAISCHYSYLPEYKEAYLQNNAGIDKQPERQVPDELINGIQHSKHINESLLNLRQVAFSVFDMKVHGPASHDNILKLSISGSYNTLRKEIGLIDGPEALGQPDDWGHGYAISPHFMENQAAAYYSYLYTRVFSMDIFTAFQDDPMDSALGKRYRHQVLEKGGSQDELETLTEFLGRAPTAAAFEADLGLCSS